MYVLHSSVLVYYNLMLLREDNQIFSKAAKTVFCMYEYGVYYTRQVCSLRETLVP